MSDPERALLSCALRAADMTPVISAGIGIDDLEDREHQNVLQWMYDHFHRFQGSPGLDALRSNFPAWKLDDPSDGIDFYIAAVRVRQRYNLMQDNVVRITLELKNDERSLAASVEAAQAVFQSVTTDLLTEYAEVQDEDITLEPSWGPRIDFYDDLRANPGQLRGYRTGFRTIDIATRGIQPGQFIVIAGVKKSGKSTLELVLGITLNDQGARVLMFNFEMSDWEMKARHDARRARIDPRRLLDGRSSAAELDRLEKALKRAEDGFPFTIVTDQEAQTTVSAVAAKIAEHKPDVALIDGAYLMEDEFGEPPGTERAQRNISRGLARTARRTGVPIVATTQALEAKVNKRVGITSFAIGYTSAWAQDATTTLLLQPVEDPPNSAELRVGDSRSGPKATSMLTWDFTTMTFEERFGDIDGDAGDQDGGSTPDF